MLGLAELIHALRLLCIAPKKRALTYMVIYLNDDCAEQQLAHFLEQRAWLGSRYADFTIAIDSDLSEKNKQACHRLAENSDIIFCGSECLDTATGTLLPDA